jgi:hypothetical protein
MKALFQSFSAGPAAPAAGSRAVNEEEEEERVQLHVAPLVSNYVSMKWCVGSSNISGIRVVSRRSMKNRSIPPSPDIYATSDEVRTENYLNLTRANFENRAPVPEILPFP